MRSLKECCDCCNNATPLNTPGMGGVDPLITDPIPSCNKKHRLKSLKEKIRQKIRKHVKEKDINGEYR